MRRIKQYLITGFLIVAPISISLFLFVSFVQLVDYYLAPLAEGLIGHAIPGMGLIVAFILLMIAGFLGSNISGQHILEFFEDILLRIPVFNWLYKTVKQLTEVFGPGGKAQFKSVVMVEYPRPGVYSLGFVTNKVRFQRHGEPESLLYAVYIATNHLYIGDVILVPEEKIIPTTMTLQEGVQCFLSAGASIPSPLISPKPAPRKEREE